ncbi:MULTISPECIES: adenosine deaminase [unclassified Saccharopolyspora]|uniref:adenosine deaminase n=1 Tax=Saccharopolyspora TaxID=1835 RepID=UPI00190B275C|nr:adenosine deaminase [Saccharopolyspora sp. HNM0986]
MDEFIAALPKVELHVHLVGSASFETVLDLASRHPDAGVPTTRRELAEFYRFRDFEHFIRVYVAVNSLVRTSADVTRLVTGLATDLAAQRVRYAEVTVTVFSHLFAWLTDDEMLTGLTEGRAAAREQGVELAWCFDIPGGHPAVGDGMDTVRFGLVNRPEGLVSLGLGGIEVDRARFTGAFAAARAAGLRSVPHAGETTGPESIWTALRELGAERIGHGISAVRDHALIEHLAAEQVPLELCPTSNLRTRQIAAIGAHPVRQLRDNGVLVTLNTDDPPMFGTDLNREYRVVAESLELDRAEVADLARNAVTASFLDEPGKARILGEIDDVLAAHADGP